MEEGIFRQESDSDQDTTSIPRSQSKKQMSKKRKANKSKSIKRKNKKLLDENE